MAQTTGGVVPSTRFNLFKDKLTKGGCQLVHFMWFGVFFWANYLWLTFLQVTERVEAHIFFESFFPFLSLANLSLIARQNARGSNFPNDII
jgi:hypothetical protein